MKIKVTNKKKFSPITFTIKVESEDELAELYMRTYPGYNEMKQSFFEITKSNGESHLALIKRALSRFRPKPTHLFSAISREYMRYHENNPLA